MGMGMAGMMMNQQQQWQQQQQPQMPVQTPPSQMQAGQATCGNCKATVPPGKFCAECGKELAVGPKFCTNCGQPVTGKFCGNCGTAG